MSVLTKHDKSLVEIEGCRASEQLQVNSLLMEVHVKFFSLAPLLMCALVASGFSTIGASKANAASGGTAMASPLAQEAAQDNSATPNLSGSWQMSWTAGNGNQRQVTMEIKQDSFSVKLPKRQASFTGTIDGNKMSGTTEQGSPWTATRQ
jgi:hypothetical protein